MLSRSIFVSTLGNAGFSSYMLYYIVNTYLISVSLWLHRSAGSNTTALPTNWKSTKVENILDGENILILYHSVYVACHIFDYQCQTRYSIIGIKKLSFCHKIKFSILYNIFENPSQVVFGVKCFNCDNIKYNVVKV